MRSFALMVLVLAFSLPTGGVAKELDIAGFQDGCRELLAIAKSRSQDRFLAWQTTSPAEAMRAGICQGTLAEYLRDGRCPRGQSAVVADWFEMAGRVTVVDLRQVRDLTELLNVSACGHAVR